MCLTSTKYGLNPMIPHKDDRPRCSVKGCKLSRAIISCLKDGSPSYRKVCYDHHKKNTASNRGVSSIDEVTAINAGFKTVYEYKHSIATQKGFTDWRAYKNSKHPYRKYRKDYCENIDGRLGYTCTTTIVHMIQLDVDHKDGNHLNNKPRNLQTLCKCCHSYKGLIYEDYKSPGRKTRKVI
jgi:hypothetical protein